jgi:hypothetical protein
MYNGFRDEEKTTMPEVKCPFSVRRSAAKDV